MYKINALINMNDIESLKLVDSDLTILDTLGHRVAVSFKITFNGTSTELLKSLNRMYENFKHYTVSTM